GGSVPAQVLRSGGTGGVTGPLLGQRQAGDGLGGGFGQRGGDAGGQRTRWLAGAAGHAEVGEVVVEFAPGGVGAPGVVVGPHPPPPTQHQAEHRGSDQGGGGRGAERDSDG